jgi:hypothetical protein
MVTEHDKHGSSPKGSNIIAAEFRADGRSPAAPLPPEVEYSLATLTEACGDNLVGIIFFGSRLLGTSPNVHSAADIFVIVDGDLGAGTKCFVMRRAHLRESLIGHSRDHFCRGRMMQRCQVIYARRAADRDELEKWLQIVRERTLDWVPLFLGDRWDVMEYCRRMLEVSYANEIRPEARSRVWEVLDAQRHYFKLTYGRILEKAVEDARLTKSGTSYRLAMPPGFLERLHWRLFFLRSRTRATLRWLKYMLTFDDWLDYIARKAERRTGIRIELTQAERRFPIILLWPKAIRVLKAMGSGGAESGAARAQAKPPRDQDKPGGDGA